MEWNASADVDGPLPVARDEWIANPETSLLGQVTKLLGKDEATQKEAAFDEVDDLLSQLLHGEQAALQICGQLTNLWPITDEKSYAANPVYDEARHAEVFARLPGEKLGTIHPIMAELKILLEELLSVDVYTMKCLGMQTLFEDTMNELVRDGIRRVERVEARNAVFRVLTMRRRVKSASREEMARLEDRAFGSLEALNANQQLDMVNLFAPKYGYDPERIVHMLLSLMSDRRGASGQLPLVG